MFYIYSLMLTITKTLLAYTICYPVVLHPIDLQNLAEADYGKQIQETTQFNAELRVLQKQAVESHLYLLQK